MLIILKMKDRLNTIQYLHLVLDFGLVFGRSISAGIFSASVSITLQGTFQGILAWKSAGSGAGLLTHNDSSNNAYPIKSGGSSLSDTPDYYWFAATVGIVGIVQGEVDFKIIKATVLIKISIIAGIAFEQGYGTEVTVDAQVRVTARIKIVFVTIHFSFHTSIHVFVSTDS